MNEKKPQYIVGGAMLVVAALIVYFGINFMAQDGTNISDGSDNDLTAAEYSVDNPSEPYKTLSYAEAVEKLNQADGKQAFYIGCRDCIHCSNLESVLKPFLNDNSDKNANRDLVYKVEAGYSCVPETTDDTYEDYVKIFNFLVNNNLATTEYPPQFGTPQFIYVEDGKVVDELDNYDRTADGLTDLFSAHSYRSF